MHRKVGRGLTAALFGVLVMAGSAAQAAPEFKVSGVTVSMAEDGWELFEAKAPPGLLGHGGIDGTMPSQARLLVNRDSAGNVRAAVLVSSNFGSKRPVTLRGTCPDGGNDEAMYAVRIGDPMGGPRTCVLVGGPYGRSGVMKFLATLEAARAERGFEVPTNVVLLWGYSVDQMAAYFEVEGVVSREFIGLEGRRPTGEMRAKVDPAVAAWGDAFSKALKEALSGVFSRSTTLPPFVFRPAEAATR